MGDRGGDARVSDQHGDGDNGWHQVYNNKGKRSGISSGQGKDVHGNDRGVSKNANPNPNMKILNRMSMSFYITNFPHKITSKEIYNRCMEFGVVSDAFVSNRLSKAGKRFGFVRFIKVGNADKLLNDLRSIWFGNFKLFADIEKYGRKIHKAENSAKQDVDVNENKTPPVKVTSQNGKSYAEALSPNSGNHSFVSSSCRVVKLSNESTSLDINERSVLVKVTLPEHIPYARVWLNEEGFVDVVVKYVGGRWVHVTFANMEAKHMFMSNTNLKSRYIALKTPSDMFVPDERMVWVNISGVPKGAWSNQNFQEILGTWGNGVFFGPQWDSSVSMGKICVLTQSKKHIFEELVVEFQNARFDIWIKEFTNWDPKIIRLSYESDQSEGFGSEEESDGESESSESKSIGEHSENYDPELCKGASLDSQVNDNQEVPPQDVNGKNNPQENPSINTVDEILVPSTKGVDNVGNNSGNGTCEESHDSNKEKETVPEFTPPKEAIEEAIVNDVFSLDRIIEGDSNRFNRDGSRSSSNPVSSGAPGFVKGAFLPEDGDTFCNSEGYSSAAANAKEILDSGFKMGFGILGDLKSAESMVNRISEVEGFQ